MANGAPEVVDSRPPYGTSLARFHSALAGRNMRSELAIRAAVMNCLTRCTDSVAPLCGMVEFLDNLAAIGWHEKDIRKVQEGDLQLIGKREKATSNDGRTDATLGDRQTHCDDRYNSAVAAGMRANTLPVTSRWKTPEPTRNPNPPISHR